MKNNLANLKKNKLIIKSIQQKRQKKLIKMKNRAVKKVELKNEKQKIQSKWIMINKLCHQRKTVHLRKIPKQAR